MDATNRLHAITLGHHVVLSTEANTFLFGHAFVVQTLVDIEPKTNDHELDAMTPTTPPRKEASNSSQYSPQKETPAVPCHTSGGAYQSGDLDDAGRTAVLMDLGSVNVFPTADLAIILPSPLTRDEMAKTKVELAQTITNGRWTRWPNDPRQSSTHEDNTFTPLKDLFIDIIDACQKVTGRAPTVDMINNPTRAPTSVRSNSARPDGFLALRETKAQAGHHVEVRKPFMLRPRAALSTLLGDKKTDDMHWEDIAVPTEYEKEEKGTDIADVGMTPP